VIGECHAHPPLSRVSGGATPHVVTMPTGRLGKIRSSETRTPQITGSPSVAQYRLQTRPVG